MSKRSAGAWLLAGAGVLATALAHAAAAVPVTGVVHLERDGRPGRGADEPGIAGVLVSDGRQLQRTDARGRYRIEASPGAALFVIKPAGHRFLQGEDGLPAFWAQVPDAGPAQLDFGLSAAPPGPDRFEALVFTDTQVKNARDIDHYRRSVVEPLGRPQAALGMTLGDLVDDRTGLYPALNAVTTRLGVPWFHVPGNHDLDPDATSDAGSLRAWSDIYGPDTYAVEEGAAAFVLLDNVIATPGEGAGYTGGLREDQFRFLEAYLATLPPQRLLVLGMHIPLFETGGRASFRAQDRRRLFGLLRDHPRVLVLSGHSHGQQHYWHGAEQGWEGASPLHEYNMGAVCGAFWSGAPDARGIPDTTMSDGTPHGHALLTVEDDAGYALAYRPARADGTDPAFTTAMALHAPRVLRRGAYPAYGVFANVFMGDADTRVEYRIDAGPWMPMRRVQRADPRLLLENAADDLSPALRGYDRSPEATASTHLWRGALDTGLAAGTHRVEVRAFDRWQGQVVASTSYALEEAHP